MGKKYDPRQAGGRRAISPIIQTRLSQLSKNQASNSGKLLIGNKKESSRCVGKRLRERRPVCLVLTLE